MYRLASALLIVVLSGLISEAQQQVRGQVINRDGAPQQCQVEFWAPNASQPQYRVVTDGRGFFYLSNPSYGSYRAVVMQGRNRQEFQVRVDQYGLHPPTLVVNW
jgi:hypothetical protein